MRNIESILQKIEEYKASFLLKGLVPITKYYDFSIEDTVAINVVANELDSIPYRMLVIPEFVNEIICENKLVSGLTEKLIFNGDIKIYGGAFYYFDLLNSVTFKGNAYLDDSCFEMSNIDTVYFKGEKVYIGDKVFLCTVETTLKFYSSYVEIGGSECLAENMVLDFSDAPLKSFSINKDADILGYDESFEIIVSDYNADYITHTFIEANYLLEQLGQYTYRVIQVRDDDDFIDEEYQYD